MIEYQVQSMLKSIKQLCSEDKLYIANILDISTKPTPLPSPFPPLSDNHKSPFYHQCYPCLPIWLGVHLHLCVSQRINKINKEAKHADNDVRVV